MSANATPKKTLSSSTMSSGNTARKPASSSSPTPKTAPSSAVLSSNGVARTASHKSSSSISRPARPGVRRPGSVAGPISNLSIGGNEDNGKDEDARAETAALIDSLKKSVRDAELVSEDYNHQLAGVQQRLDELMQEHAKLEERYHESTEKTEELQTQARDSSRQVREMEAIYESERVAMMKDREDSNEKEAELKRTIQRLKESMAGKEARLQDTERPSLRKGRSPGRSPPTDETAQFAPSSASTQRSDSKGTSRLVMQKDQIIEGLRLELAEAQIKLVEMENRGGGRLQELERSLLEARMTNARLMEDNESFQLLLGERTLNGDFQKGDLMQAPDHEGSKLGSLAEELESAEGEPEKSDNYRRVEAEAKSLRDQNKALTLYIEKIISRVLQHENFETILDQKPEGLGGMFGSASTDKDLPPPPPVEKDDAGQTTFLGRAMSVARRQRPASQMFSPNTQAQDELTAGNKPRPQSQMAMPPPEHIPSANENPDTAPSIPLGRAASVSTRGRNHHRRTQSEVPEEMPGAAAVINQMYRGPSRDSTGPISPMSPGGSTARSQYFGPGVLTGSSGNSGTGRPHSGSRAVSGLRAASAGQGTKSASDSTISHESGDLPSPPRNSAGNTVYTGAVTTQNKLRPLRLVQNEEAQKKANRGSWMGWFNRGKEEGVPRTVSGNAEQGSDGPGP